MAPDVIPRRASAHRQALRAASRIAFTYARRVREVSAARRDPASQAALLGLAMLDVPQGTPALARPPRSRLGRGLTSLATTPPALFGLGALGSLGCLEAAPGVDETAPDDEGDGALDAAPEPDAAAERDALIDFVAEDARVDVEGDGALVDDTDAEASDAALADALPDVTPSDDTRAGCAQVRDDVDAWVACCEAINWDFNRDPACAAWGPPMPPAMPSAMPSMPAEVV